MNLTLDALHLEKIHDAEFRIAGYKPTAENLALPQGSVEYSLRSGFYVEPFSLLNHIETSKPLSNYYIDNKKSSIPGKGLEVLRACTLL